MKNSDRSELKEGKSAIVCSRGCDEISVRIEETTEQSSTIVVKKSVAVRGQYTVMGTMSNENGVKKDVFKCLLWTWVLRTRPH